MALKDFKTFQANANPHSTIGALSILLGLPVPVVCSIATRSDQDMIAVEIKKQLI